MSTNRQHLLATILVLCGGLAFAVFALPKAQMSLSKPSVSEFGTVVYFPEFRDSCPVGRTPDDLRALGKLTQVSATVRSKSGTFRVGSSTDYEPISVEGLKDSGRVFFVHHYTKVGVLQREGGLMNVRILSGVHEGRDGWVSASAFQPSNR
jgi:hypothetical protein